MADLSDNSDLLDALERQRQEIAGEIHDDLMPYLFAASAAISAHQRTALDGGSGDHLADASQWMDQSRRVARQILAGLMLPEAVCQNPLIAAKEFIQGLAADPGSRSTQLQWVNCQAADRYKWAPPQAVAVYRIVTELVRNAIRHARANQIQVEVSEIDSGLEVHISDDGIGMPTEDSIPTTSFGLRLARDRAAWIHAELKQMTPECGTRFRLIIRPQKI